MSSIPASVLRDFAESQGLAVGRRGRISREVLLAFLASHPHTTRALANEQGIKIGVRGRISPATVEAVASAIR